MLYYWKMQKKWMSWEYRSDIENAGKLIISITIIGLVTTSPVTIPSALSMAGII